MVTVYTDGTYYALTHNGTTLSLSAVTVENGQVTSELTDAQLWSYNGKLGYTSGSTTRYLYAASRGGWGGWGGWNSLTSISLSTSGSSVTYSGSSLKLGNSYLYYSNGSVYTNRSYASTCYVFELNN